MYYSSVIDISSVEDTTDSGTIPHPWPCLQRSPLISLSFWYIKKKPTVLSVLSHIHVTKRLNMWGYADEREGTVQIGSLFSTWSNQGQEAGLVPTKLYAIIMVIIKNVCSSHKKAKPPEDTNSSCVSISSSRHFCAYNTLTAVVAYRNSFVCLFQEST